MLDKYEILSTQFAKKLHYKIYILYCKIIIIHIEHLLKYYEKRDMIKFNTHNNEIENVTKYIPDIETI